MLVLVQPDFEFVNLGYLFVVVLVFGSSFFAARGLAQISELRYDGIYYRTGDDATNHHFRFYRDGWVISAATPAEKRPSQIARWFHRGWPLLAEGRILSKIVL